jgi:hypothetical protein
MPYPEPSDAQIADFAADGFVVVPDVVPPEDVRLLEAIAVDIVARRERVAKDWDWRAGEALADRAWRIVQCGVSDLHPELARGRWRRWTTEAASRLLGRPVEFWYDQFLGKPPRASAPTPWHQDEAYWGRGLSDRGVTCWLALHDVEPRNGCMHFVRGVHRRPVREHRNPPEMASDLLVCGLEPGDEVVACPLRVGSVVFHHSRTPHMTPANVSDAWRLSIAQHFAEVGHARESEPYDWRIHVDQASGRRTRAVDGAVVQDGLPR